MRVLLFRLLFRLTVRTSFSSLPALLLAYSFIGCSSALRVVQEDYFASESAQESNALREFEDVINIVFCSFSPVLLVECLFLCHGVSVFCLICRDLSPLVFI